MRKIGIVECPSWIMDEEREDFIRLSKGVYEKRIDLLLSRMKEKGMDFVVVYGDREHFASIEYFTRYDCRFEEGLFILAADGRKYIVVGNEGMDYSYTIPVEIERIMYRHFSLQGQPRHGIQKLREVFAMAGIAPGSKVGFVGFKYFTGECVDDPLHSYDVPTYIMKEVFAVAGEENVINFTEEITGMPNGIRMRLYTAEEVAFFEYQAVKTANVMRRLLKAAKPGLSETQIARCAEADLTPTQMYSLVKVCVESMQMGLRSPQEDLILEDGEVLGLCYSMRGSLCCKSGIGASGPETVVPRLKDSIETFFKPHWAAVAAWLEAIHVGATGHELYHAAMDIIDAPEFGVSLNPGHYIGMDEWTNSCSADGDTTPILSGVSIQTDIIASSTKDTMVSICEDTVVIADANLRAQIKAEYPEVYARIEKRQEMLRNVLNVQISDDVLPMSALVGVMFPYMLNQKLVYAIEK